MALGTCTASHVFRQRRPTTSSRPHHNSPATSLVSGYLIIRISGYPDGLTVQQIDIRIPACVSSNQQIQSAHTARACAVSMTDSPGRHGRIGQPPPMLRGCPGAARVAFSVRFAVAARDASTHLTEWDETLAAETRGGAEACKETMCDLLGLGCQWADFARRTCV